MISAMVDFRGPMARLAYDAAHFTGVNRLGAARYGGLGTIFMLHSVVEDAAPYLYDVNHTTLAFLERFLRWAKSRDMEFISLDALVERLGAPTQSRRFATITFDDGYADNFIKALPLLEKYRVPFAVYVTTDMITREAYFWWRGLQCLFRDNEEVRIDALGQSYTCSSLKEKTAAYRKTKLWVTQDVTARAPLLQPTFSTYGISLSELLDREALSVGQLRELADHPLVTIGGHTTSHPELAKLSEPEVRKEIAENRQFLESVTGRPVHHFAYPYGGPRACGQREENIVAGLGFKSATTTRLGNIFAAHHLRPCALPRARFSGSREFISFMAMQMTGIRELINSRMAPPVVTM